MENNEVNCCFIRSFRPEFDQIKKMLGFYFKSHISDTGELPIDVKALPDLPEKIYNSPSKLLDWLGEADDMDCILLATVPNFLDDVLFQQGATLDSSVFILPPLKISDMFRIMKHSPYHL